MSMKNTTRDRGRSDSVVEESRLSEAFAYAAEAHAGQMRKGKPRPYIGHLMGVAALVLQYGGDEEQAIAALLHDAVEDAGGRPRLDDIRARFGERVARIVEGCSDSLAEEPTKKAPWRERKRGYLARVPEKPAEVKLVSAADKLHNVREVVMDVRAEGAETLERFSGKRKGTLWYYRALVDAFRAGEQSPQLNSLLDEYERTVAELEHLAGSPS
jgi:(p)ppGpp synthase/HD superfamily hydrolase